jgi:quercetin dioxygenase-like cupin family protein
MINVLAPVTMLSLAAVLALQHTLPSADEVTLRHKIYEDGRANVFLLDIPPGQATVVHRHDKDLLTVFVNGGRTRASFNGGATVEDTFPVGDVRFRSAGFTHFTENTGAEHFLAVIFEFSGPQGPRVPSAESPTHLCEGAGQDRCVDRTRLFCTDRFCIDRLSMASQATASDVATSQDQIFVAVSDYTLANRTAGIADVVHTKRSGEVERIEAGGARRWTNVGSKPSQLVVVSFR